MASEEYRELLQLGPFAGIDYTTTDNLIDKNRGINATNCNPGRLPGALVAERGRKFMLDLAGVMGKVTAVFSCTGFSDEPFVLIQGTGLVPGAAPVTVLYRHSTGTYATVTGGLAFTKAIQYGSVIYTNAGQRFFLTVSGGTPGSQFYNWQYNPPVANGNIGLASAGAGNMAAGTYFYVFTQTTNMPDGSVSETSIDINQFAHPPQVTIGANLSIQIAPLNGFLFTGTNPDGTTYTTNVYRQSSNQAGYLFVENVTANGSFIDNFSDAAILGNAQLIVHRDPPPVSTSNLGQLCVHKNRSWCFVTVDNANTLSLPQVQLWYSNVDRPWEFNNTGQVLLLQSDVTAAPIAQSPDYTTLYGNEPMGLAEVGTILLAFKKRETWGVYGDDQSSFLPRNLFSIGCAASKSVTPVVGGCFWLSENGVYYFDGAAPAYDSARITDYLRPVPGTPGAPGSNGITPKDQALACGSFSNLTYYLSFPTLQKTLGYNTTSGEWTGVLPYAPTTSSAIHSIAANPSYYGGLEWNEVVAARGSNGTSVDWWFADTNYDLGLPQTCTWVGGASFAPQDSFEKQYRYLTLTGPIQPGSAVVTLTVDPGSVPAKQFVWTIPDLSITPRNMVGVGDGAGGALRGFMANLSVQLTGLAGQPLPQVWDVKVWGQVPPDRNLVPRT